ncbi:MAG: nitrile hydratase subunit beta [Alphaproteobacteria bacterium]|nr:nitrile hydratase subunit beta [Alphaproteobacteria bacterium]
MTASRRVHDMGGLAAGPVDRDEPPHAAWEMRIDAIRALVAKRKLLRTDEIRRNAEDLGPGVYDKLSYHERRCAAITNALLQKNVFTVDELGRKMAEVERRWSKEQNR